jgi:hypothetical protein
MLATAVLVAYGVGIPIWALLLGSGSPRPYTIPVLATAVYTPVHLRLALVATRGRRTRESWILLAVLAVVVLSVIPLEARDGNGWEWLPVLSILAGHVLVIVPPPWSVSGFAALVALPAVVDYMFSYRLAIGITVWDTLKYGLALAVLVWLVQLIRRVRAGRHTLAESAVITQRVHVDGQLLPAVIAALEQIIEAGERGLQTADPRIAESQLHELVGRSRRTLAESRAALSRYHQTSPQAELDTVMILLAAAGIHGTVVLPANGLPSRLPAEVQTELRAGLTRLLAERPSHCVITIETADSSTGFGVRMHASPPPRAAAA